MAASLCNGAYTGREGANERSVMMIIIAIITTAGISGFRFGYYTFLAFSLSSSVPAR